MNSQQFKCPKCGLLFTQANPPKSLINCSHTLCFNCLQVQIICPIDKSRIQVRKYKIESFQTNKQILQSLLQSNQSFKSPQISTTKRLSSKNQLVDHSSKQNAQVVSSSYLTTNQNQFSSPLQLVSQNSLSLSNPNLTSNLSPRKTFQTCSLHSKKADLICIEDKKLICSDCGLFGDHKPHQLITYDQFIQRFSQMTQQCFQTFKVLQSRQQNISQLVLLQQINKRLFKKKQEQLLKIKQYFRFYNDLLKATQKQMILNLQLSLQFKKQKILENSQVTEIQNKLEDYFKNVQRMSDGLSQIFNFQNIQQYVSFLDNTSKDSQLQKTGLYLLVQLDNFEKMNQDNLTKQIADLSYTYKNLPTLFQPTFTLNSNDWMQISKTIEKFKQKNSKISKISTPSKNTTVLIQSNKNKASPLQNDEQQNLLSPTKPYQHSPLQSSPLIQSVCLPTFQSRITQTHKQNHAQFSTSRLLKIPKTTNKNSKNGSSHRLKLIKCDDQFQDTQTRNSKPKSITRHSTEKQFFNVLGEKNIQNKRKRKPQLPQKQAKIYEDLLKDKLEVLDLGKGYLGNTNILLISELFPTRCRLKTVKLMYNRITDQIFIELVSRCKAVTSLNLGGNQLSQKSLQWLQKEANNLGELKNITLSCNKIVLRNVKQRLQILKEKGLTVSL